MSKLLSRRKINSEAKAKWNEALKDAEKKMNTAKVEAQRWALVAKTCRERIEEGAPWPCSIATQSPLA